MLKAGLISCLNKNKAWKVFCYLINTVDLTLILYFHNKLPSKKCWFVECNMSTRQKDTEISKIPSSGYVAKKWLDEVTKSRVLNEASLESQNSMLSDKFKL